MAIFHPGQFPVGSPSSRAAARSLMDERRSHARLADIVGLYESSSKPVFGPWKDNGDGSFTRLVRLPAGMTFEEAEIASGVAPVRTSGRYTRLICDL